MRSIELDPRVTMLGAFRPVGDHDGRLYGAVGFRSSTQRGRHLAVEQLCRMALTLKPRYEPGDYAILDGYDDEGDIVADYGIPDKRTFDYLYRKLQWRWERFDE